MDGQLLFTARRPSTAVVVVVVLVVVLVVLLVVVVVVVPSVPSRISLPSWVSSASWTPKNGRDTLPGFCPHPLTGNGAIMMEPVSVCHLKEEGGKREGERV